VPVERIHAMLLALLFVAFAWHLVNATPLVRNGSLINAPDEHAHIGYVRALAVGHRLPVKADREYPTYQWHQPPLYYAVAALAYPLGLVGMRAVSVLFGLISIFSIWTAVRLVAPSGRAIALLALGAVALLPMRQAVYASVGNDAAIECMFSLAMLCMAHLCVRGFTPRRAATMGLLVGMATLTKLSGVLLFAPAALVLFLCPPRTGLRQRTGRALWPLLIGVALASPWFALNVQRYGQLMPIRAFHEEFAHTSRASDWIGTQRLAVDAVTGDLKPGPVMDRAGYLQLVANWTARTFLGAYTPLPKAPIGAPAFLPASFYALYAVLVCAAMVGLVRTAASSIAKVGPAHTLGLAGALTVILIAASFAGFTWTYFQAQGRYLYPALMPLSWAWASGISAITPKRYSGVVTAGILALLIILAAAYGFAYVAPVYAGR
jgi:4-amino-4-deoxy-L-arabinose transferase-like glycosyltransferase